MFVDDYLYGTKYANSDKAIFSIYDTTNKIDLGNSDYARYDADAVTFIIASYSGQQAGRQQVRWRQGPWSRLTPRSTRSP